MIEVLKVLKNEFESLNIPYYFDKWEDELVLPFFVGELSEVPTAYEDGKRELLMEQVQKKLKKGKEIPVIADELEEDMETIIEIIEEIHEAE